MPSISIIVPVYNSEKYLNKCINSILTQSFKDIELILVNDGSKDNSKDICERFVKSDDRVILINKNNEGVSAARNTGIERVNGKYIMFCDSDDDVDETWCEEMYNIAIDNEGSLIASGYYIHSYRGNKYELYTKKVHNEGLISIEEKKDIMKLYNEDLLNLPVNKIFDTKIIKENNIRFNEKISLGEDLLFNLEYLKCISGNILIINKPLYNYIYRNSISLSHKYYSNLFEIYNKLYGELYNSMLLFGADIDKYKNDFYNIYFEMLNRVLRNTFSKQSEYGIVKKIKYNKYVLNSSEFNLCTKNVDLGNYNYIYRKIIKYKSSLLLYFYMKLVNAKNYLIGLKNRRKVGESLTN